ncbi:MAG: YidC/Oxa1 family membrane protein insertase [Spirochaetaceae bacterium]|nr:YidC/Oxa1 family membrane protein insertase [Spirochaetaceae bacterium]
MFYQIIIYPIELIIEFVYYLFNLFTKNAGLSIIGVSTAVTLFSLPLYIIAEHWQEIERNTQKRLRPTVNRIKAVFKGDEQYMILNTYYRQQHYHPIMALRSSISLIIQVPFFIAAYHFLSNLEIIQSIPFLFIHDLGEPDALFSIGSFKINVLPIAMTIINILAGAVYTKGFPIKEKIQLYAMALLFLFLLYDSPSGLVLYWTMNNVFSLVKNIFYKTNNPARTLYFTITSICLVAGIFILFTDYTPVKKLLIISICIFILCIPLYIKLAKFLIKKPLNTLVNDKNLCTNLFIFSCLIIVLLTGVVIPSAVMSSSPQEFSFIDEVSSPLTYIRTTLFQSIGLFLFWFGCFYFMFPKKLRPLFSFFFTIIAVGALLYTFIFQKEYGTMSSSLIFDSGIKRMPQKTDILYDFLVLIISLTIAVCGLKFKPTLILKPVLQILVIILVILGFKDSMKLQKCFKEFAETRENVSLFSQSESLSPEYHLSKTNKNVVVIMLDRAIPSFLDDIFLEKPELENSFKGFKLYTNTISVNGHTLYAVPVVFGGYDYLPEQMNERSDIPMVQKHNESCLVMPVLFSRSGFECTVTDISWANYSWIPDNSIFQGYEHINAHNVQRKYTIKWATEHNIELTPQSLVLKRNFLLFSFFKILPACVRGMLYDDGTYCSVTLLSNPIESLIDSYSVLDYLPELTDTNAETPCFTLMINDLTHGSAFMQVPDYEPADSVTNFGLNRFYDEYTFKTYHTNIATFNKLGEWFNYLREEGVYDNTRIILVSDHGAELDLSEFDQFGENKKIPARYNPLLMVKDFNSSEPFCTDSTFMCNGDVLSIAIQDIISVSNNPFTNNSIDTERKNNGIAVYTNSRYTPEMNKTNTFILDGEIYNVKDDIFNPENWEKIQ